MPSFADQAASRRKFLQFLAGSPLLAAGGLEAFAGEGPVPGSKLPDPLMWAPMRTTELIKAPKEAMDFANSVASATAFEIQSSQLAQKNAKSAEVKAFADQMIANHTKAAGEFKADVFIRPVQSESKR